MPFGSMVSANTASLVLTLDEYLSSAIIIFQVQLHGGNVTEHVTPETTHLVGDAKPSAAEHML